MERSDALTLVTLVVPLKVNIVFDKFAGPLCRKFR
jgi:hypothetical protein